MLSVLTDACVSLFLDPYSGYICIEMRERGRLEITLILSI